MAEPRIIDGLVLARTLKVKPSRPAMMHDERVDITQLHDGSVVTVSTRNSTYRLTIQDSEHRLAAVEGGHFFEEPVVARIEGTPFEDGPPQVGIIQPGLRMEILAGDQRIVTSPVRSLDVAA
jgi:hypothetical protein